jgi:hypothetical protein
MRGRDVHEFVRYIYETTQKEALIENRENRKKNAASDLKAKRELKLLDREAAKKHNLELMHGFVEYIHERGVRNILEERKAERKRLRAERVL